jgi:hypothetical protein
MNALTENDLNEMLLDVYAAVHELNAVIRVMHGACWEPTSPIDMDDDTVVVARRLAGRLEEAT